MKNIAELIARRAHHGQTRRDQSTPFIVHPEGVVRRLSGRSDEVIATAWLHDVLEDTSTTADDLRAQGIPERVVQAVIIFTNDGTVRYREYIERIRGDAIAREVKIADMLDNLAATPSKHQILKYAAALLMLV